MGFRDLKCFNRALLGKQAWKLITKPTSLCARILKGKYYPYSDLLHANKGKHTSHTWRAIYDGKDVLQKGIINRIGNGKNTKVWEDNWIPNRKTMKPLWKSFHTYINLVAQLLDQRGESWDTNRVRQSFIPPDSNGI